MDAVVLVRLRRLLVASEDIVSGRCGWVLPNVGAISEWRNCCVY